MRTARWPAAVPCCSARGLQQRAPVALFLSALVRLRRVRVAQSPSLLGLALVASVVRCRLQVAHLPQMLVVTSACPVVVAMLDRVVRFHLSLPMGKEQAAIFLCVRARQPTLRRVLSVFPLAQRQAGRQVLLLLVLACPVVALGARLWLQPVTRLLTREVR